MSDIIDMAQDREERLRDAALAAHRQRRNHVQKGTEACVSCGETIEDGRRLAVPDTDHCAFCASQLERRRR